MCLYLKEDESPCQHTECGVYYRIKNEVIYLPSIKDPRKQQPATNVVSSLQGQKKGLEEILNKSSAISEEIQRMMRNVKMLTS